MGKDVNPSDAYLHGGAPIWVTGYLRSWEQASGCGALEMRVRDYNGRDNPGIGDNLCSSSEQFLLGLDT